MSLKELKGLAPWQWDTQTNKHPVGQKSLDAFEHVGDDEIAAAQLLSHT